MIREIKLSKRRLLLIVLLIIAVILLAFIYIPRKVEFSVGIVNQQGEKSEARFELKKYYHVFTNDIIAGKIIIDGEEFTVPKTEFPEGVSIFSENNNSFDNISDILSESHTADIHFTYEFDDIALIIKNKISFEYVGGSGSQYEWQQDAPNLSEYWNGNISDIPPNERDTLFNKLF